jgi:putative hemolysin
VRGGCGVSAGWRSGAARQPNPPALSRVGVRRLVPRHSGSQVPNVARIATGYLDQLSVRLLRAVRRPRGRCSRRRAGRPEWGSAGGSEPPATRRAFPGALNAAATRIVGPRGASQRPQQCAHLAYCGRAGPRRARLRRVDEGTLGVCALFPPGARRCREQRTRPPRPSSGSRLTTLSLRDGASPPSPAAVLGHDTSSI